MYRFRPYVRVCARHNKRKCWCRRRCLYGPPQLLSAVYIARYRPFGMGAKGRQQDDNRRIWIRITIACDVYVYIGLHATYISFLSILVAHTWVSIRSFFSMGRQVGEEHSSSIRSAWKRGMWLAQQFSLSISLSFLNIVSKINLCNGKSLLYNLLLNDTQKGNRNFSSPVFPMPKGTSENKIFLPLFISVPLIEAWYNLRVWRCV